jgi:hypothetical protein
MRLRAREAMRGRGFSRTPESVDALFDQDGKPLKFVGESGQYEAGKLAASEKPKLPKNAVQIVQQLLIWLPNDLRLYWLLAELLNAEGNPEQATGIFNELADIGYRTEAIGQHRQILREAAAASIRKPDAGSNGSPATGGTQIATDTSWMPNPWQTLAVGFGAGLLFAFLAYWQFREVRRQPRL